MSTFVALQALADAGVRAIVLDGGTGSQRASGRSIEVLVDPSQYGRAIAVVERQGWRYAWVRSGLLRVVPGTSYWWDGGTDVAVQWAVAGAPLPSRFLGGLTRALWASAEATEQPLILEPTKAALLVYLAVQSCRPVPQRDDWRRFLSVVDEGGDATASMTVARRVGVTQALGRALAAARAGRQRPGAGPLFDDAREAVWTAACALDARVRPRRWRRTLAGAPRLGDAAIRCRVHSTEVLAPAGVFVPTPDADRFVAIALSFLRSTERPRVVEAGAGCGAIALAIARARPGAEVHGTELDMAAVRAARRNARRLGSGAAFHAGSLLDPVPNRLGGTVDLVLANLPFYPARAYAPIGSVRRDTIQGEGDDGLDLVRRLARDARDLLRPGGLMVVQMFARQWRGFSRELVSMGYTLGEAHPTGPFVIAAAAATGGAVVREIGTGRLKA